MAGSGRMAAAAVTLVVAGVSAACGVGAKPAGTPSPSAVSPTVVPSELTRDGDLSLNPPAPTSVRGTATGRDVQLSWGLPPEVTVPHRYSDRVIGYRVYRRGPGEVELRPVATATGLGFTDRAPGSGEFAYAVASIHDGDVEGSRSDPAVLVAVS